MSFMKDANGKYSSMRVMSLIALLFAIIFSGITLVNDAKRDVGIRLTAGFLFAAIAPLSIQKFAERKSKLNSD